MRRSQQQRRLGFAVKVLGNGGMPSHDTRRWRSAPSIEKSIEFLHDILDYLDRIDVRMYRISSDFVPYGTHPEMLQFRGQIERSATALAELGARARLLDIRLSLHPSQYIVLNAQDENIARKSAMDIDQQAHLLDAMGQGPDAVVVLHVGGLYRDKASGIVRFIERFRSLSEPARRRLVVENDEAAYTIEDCIRIHEETGVPVVFDHHHHRLNPGTMSISEAARAAFDTWPSDVIPKVHFSSPRLDNREVRRGKELRLEKPLLRQHADYVDPWTLADFLQPLSHCKFDVMIEAKAKDLSVLKLQDDLETIGSAHLLFCESEGTGAA